MYIGAFLGTRRSCWGIVFWLGFGQRTPRGFSLESFHSGVSVFFFALSLSPSSSPLPPPSFLVAGLGVSSCSSFCVSCRTATDFRYQFRPEPMIAHVFSPLSARVGRLFSPLLLLPSLSLSLSSLLHACTVNLVDPASSHMRVSKIKFAPWHVSA